MPRPSTFSIVAADPESGEVGVAVASRFFAVGTVVPHARAGVGAVATQSYANTDFGPHGLSLLSHGNPPKQVLEVLLGNDKGRTRRQVGLVTAEGKSASYTGSDCNAWAGGRSGPNYAVQGNILTGEKVVVEMEKAFLSTAGKPLGPDPIAELGRLLAIGLVNDSWNRGWTAFTKKQSADALRWQEVAAKKAETQPEVLPEVLYDLAVIRLANGDLPGARSVLARAVTLNPKLAEQARVDGDLAALRNN
jgi:uncharacterized Ntn-hydrolase superfamily protein